MALGPDAPLIRVNPWTAFIGAAASVFGGGVKAGEREFRKRVETAGRASPNSPTVTTYARRGRDFRKVPITVPNPFFVPQASGPMPGGGGGIDRDLYGLPSTEAQRIQRQRDAAKLEKLNRSLVRASPQLRVFDYLARQFGKSRLRRALKRLRGARGVRWVFQNGRWWQVGRGVLAGGLPSLILTGVLNLPSPAPTGRARTRVVDPRTGAKGPWRYPDPRTGRYTRSTPAGVPPGGGRVTQRATPSATGPTKPAAGPGVQAPIKPYVVQSRRVPVPPVRPALPRWVQLVQKAAPLLPLLLPKKDSKGAKASATANPIVNFPTGAPQLAPAPLTGFQPREVGSRSKDCDCGPKRPRKPRKPRSVCYRGSYVETATGITKRKRERIPCQPSRKRPR